MPERIVRSSKEIPERLLKDFWKTPERLLKESWKTPENLWKFPKDSKEYGLTLDSYSRVFEKKSHNNTTHNNTKTDS